MHRAQNFVNDGARSDGAGTIASGWVSGLGESADAREPGEDLWLIDSVGKTGG